MYLQLKILTSCIQIPERGKWLNQNLRKCKFLIQLPFHHQLIWSYYQQLGYKLLRIQLANCKCSHYWILPLPITIFPGGPVSNGISFIPNVSNFYSRKQTKQVINMSNVFSSLLIRSNSFDDIGSVLVKFPQAIIFFVIHICRKAN